MAAQLFLALLLVSNEWVVGCDSYSVGQVLPSTKQHKAAAPSSIQILQETWDYNSKYDIGYEVATSTATSTVPSDANANANNGERNSYRYREPVLLLNGFGMGSFHQHRLVPELLKRADDDDNGTGTVYCLDYLGQGRSWPRGCNDGTSEHEGGLQYSADTWCEQIIDFLEQVVIPSEQRQQQASAAGGSAPKQAPKVHLVGNSVGGHLAAHVAVRRPDLVASICLLNPTPVWGSKLPGWNGHLPAPAIPKAVGRYLFDRIRDLKTIEKFLEATYSAKESYTEELMHQIRGATMGTGGHAAFASIMWSPPLVSGKSNYGFHDCLRHLPSDIDALLVFGADDPWCKPAFARDMLAALEERRARSTGGMAAHRYLQIANAGHCPNHEAPTAVGHLVRAWVGAGGDRRKGGGALEFGFGTTDRAKHSDNSDNTAAHHNREGLLSFAEDWAEHGVEELDRDDIPLGWIDRIATRFL